MFENEQLDIVSVCTTREGSLTDCARCRSRWSQGNLGRKTDRPKS